MRINESFSIEQTINPRVNNNHNSLTWQIFPPQNKLSKNTKTSYLSSPKYFEIKELVNKYDLSNKNISISPILTFAINEKTEFEKEFGTIKSSSMQDIITNPLSQDYDFDLNKKINEMRKTCRNNGNYAENIAKQMKAKKIGNCCDISAVTQNILNKKNTDYKGDLLYASILSDNVLCNHIAVLVRQKSETGKTPQKDALVLDNWLGGVFKYENWIKILKKIYNSKEVSTYIDYSQQ